MSNLNYDPAEVGKFNELASRWWDPEGEFKPLHRMNPVRTDYIDQTRTAGLENVAWISAAVAEYLAKAWRNEAL